jgi:hypothetical protein
MTDPDDPGVGDLPGRALTATGDDDQTARLAALTVWRGRARGRP